MRLLIVRLSSLGDIVMSMPVLQYLKKALPFIKIEWLVDQRFAQILAHNPHLDAIHTLPLRDLKKNIPKAIFSVIKLQRTLGRYDVILDMQGLVKSAGLSRYLGKNVIGFGKKSAKEGLSSLFYNHKVNIDFSEHILKRNLELIDQGLGVKVDFDELTHKEPYLFYENPTEDFSAFLSKTKRNVLAVLGGSWKSKVYPKEALCEALNKIEQNTLLLWSNQEEYERAKWISANSPSARVLPKMTLNDVKALIDRCDLIIGNDTGPCHMAWALNKPSVTILGCTSITRIPVNRYNVAVTSNTCVNPSKINRLDLSIQEIPPNEVAKAANQLLSL